MSLGKFWGYLLFEFGSFCTEKELFNIEQFERFKTIDKSIFVLVPSLLENFEKFNFWGFAIFLIDFFYTCSVSVNIQSVKIYVSR